MRSSDDEDAGCLAWRPQAQPCWHTASDNDDGGTKDFARFRCCARSPAAARLHVHLSPKGPEDPR